MNRKGKQRKRLLAATKQDLEMDFLSEETAFYRRLAKRSADAPSERFIPAPRLPPGAFYCSKCYNIMDACIHYPSVVAAELGTNSYGCIVRCYDKGCMFGVNGKFSLPAVVANGEFIYPGHSFRGGQQCAYSGRRLLQDTYSHFVDWSA